MRTTRWEDIKDKVQARNRALEALRDAQAAISHQLTEWAFKRLQGRGMKAVARLVSNGRDTESYDGPMSSANRSAIWQAFRHDFERPAYVILVLYSSWLAETLPADPSTLSASRTRALPTCPPDRRTHILRDTAPDDELRPHPEIVDLVIEGIETADALILPGVGTVTRGQLTIDVPGLMRFRELHERKTEPEARG